MKYHVPQSLIAYAEKLTAYYRGIDPALAEMAGPCFLNTAETTVQPQPDGRYFIITGDIPAMWLRDSAAQLKNYIPFAKGDPAVAELLRGAIAAMADEVCRDPYANAFNAAPSGAGAKDRTERSPWVWERKYEVDSLCAPLCFAHDYWQETNDRGIFTPQLHAMLQTVFSVFTREQRHESSPYFFERANCPPSDTLPFAGKGAPIGFTGMTWSGFRPSDDACRFGYLIPANLYAVVALRKAALLLRGGFGDEALAAQCAALADEIHAGVLRCGVYHDAAYGDIYAYETDGLGHFLLMDDANHPSLLALPYFGYCPAQDALYQRTRKFVLSAQNPYYCTGSAAAGVGSPHTPEGYIWPIALITQALTSSDADEIRRCLHMLQTTTAGTGRMHEAFDPSAPYHFTRPWFAWVNTLFAGLLIRLMEEDFFAHN